MERDRKVDRQKIYLALAVFVLILVLVLIMVGYNLVKKYTPSKETMDLNSYFALEGSEDMAVILNGECIEEKAIYEDGHVYISFDLVHDTIDETFYYDSNEGKLLYTTYETTYTVHTDSSDYYEGNSKKDGQCGTIIKLTDERVYLNLAYVEMFSGFSYEVYENPNRIVINTHDREVLEASVKKDTELRYRGGIKSDILVSLEKGSMVYILTSGDDWDQVLTLDGYTGYVKKNALAKGVDSEVVIERVNREQRHCLKDDETIIMGWHQVTSVYANSTLSSVLSQTKGINVISPTWFYLNNSTGGIASIASHDYVNYCHNQGIEVWALVSNLEMSVDTSQVLNTTSYRETLVSNLISKAIEYKLDGINVDIEAVDIAVGDSYIQFIRELSIRCHDNNIKLSVDNYVPSDYTAFYNRAAQAKYADYICIMAYDEHYAGDEAGSVSSLPFVRDGIDNTLVSVPANQVIVGLPFYTRVWELTPEKNDDGDIISYNTSSSAMGMNSAYRQAKANGAEFVWNDELGQYYTEYENGGKVYEIWHETEDSIALKLEIMQDRGLAGCSFWKLGMDDSGIWNTVLKYAD